MALSGLLSSLTGSLSGDATTDLGLGGALRDQVAGETDETRKKRLLQMQQQRLAGMGATPATQMLFGATGGMSSAGRGY